VDGDEVFCAGWCMDHPVCRRTAGFYLPEIKNALTRAGLYRMENEFVGWASAVLSVGRRHQWRTGWPASRTSAWGLVLLLVASGGLLDDVFAGVAAGGRCAMRPGGLEGRPLALLAVGG